MERSSQIMQEKNIFMVLTSSVTPQEDPKSVPLYSYVNQKWTLFVITQWSTTQRKTTQWSTTQHNTTEHNTTTDTTQQRSTTQQRTQHNSVAQHNGAQHNGAQRSTTQHNGAHHNTMEHSTTEQNTLPVRLLWWICQSWDSRFALVWTRSLCTPRQKTVGQWQDAHSSKMSEICVWFLI